MQAIVPKSAPPHQRIKPLVRVGQLQKGCPNKSRRAALSQGNAAKENTCSNGASGRRSASGASVLSRMASVRAIESTLHRRSDGIGRRENVVDPCWEGLPRYDHIVVSVAWVDQCAAVLQQVGLLSIVLCHFNQFRFSFIVRGPARRRHQGQPLCFPDSGRFRCGGCYFLTAALHKLFQILGCDIRCFVGLLRGRLFCGPGSTLTILGGSMAPENLLPGIAAFCSLL